METPHECSQEFANRQQQLMSAGENNRYIKPLEPFKHPFTGHPLVPSDTFDTKGLGYVYDELPPPSRMMQREEPVYAAFLKLRPLELANQSYMVHVFVMAKDAAKEWCPPEGGQDQWPEADGYAGSGAVFGGKGAECQNCLEREPFNVLIEVQETLAKLNLSRHDAALRVMCIDDIGEVKRLEDTPIGPPVVCGPAFEDLSASHASHGPDWSSKSADGNVQQMQAMLCNLGYYDRPVDGKFGPSTEAAVSKFQMFTGIKEDGIAGSITKGHLLQKRHDLSPDVYPEDSKQVSKYMQGSIINYTVGAIPGYLDQARARAEISDAFQLWGDAMGLTFQYTASGLRADVRLDFEDLSAVGEAFWGGLARPGGQLAEATRSGIKLDAAERWLLRGQSVSKEFPRRQAEAVYLFSTLVHEIGHVVGLAHSSDPNDVMWPYKKEGYDIKLSKNDVARARARVVPRSASDSAVAASPDEVASMRRELTQLRSDVAAMRADMREMSRVIGAAFDGAAPRGGPLQAVRSKQATESCCHSK